MVELAQQADADALIRYAIERVKARQATRPQTTQAFAERFRRFRLATPWFHERWYAAYDDDSHKRIYVQGPREHAKTSTVLTKAVRAIAENHAMRVGIISGTDVLAKKFANEVKFALTMNEELVDLYGIAPGDKWTEHELVLADARRAGLSGKDVNLFAVGRGGQISSRHCDLLIVDDVESADAVKSDLVREGTREWWSREVLPVLSPGGKLIATGTRKHFDDLYSYWLANRWSDDNPDGWFVLDDAKSVWMEPDAIDEGTPIWPEFWSAPALRQRKAELDAQDLLAWPQEYLNDPRPAGTQMFFPEKWPTFSRTPKGLTYYQFWDLAISEKATADYTCGITIGVDTANNAYLLELRRGHWDFNRTLAEIGDMGTRWSEGGALALIGIEQVAYQASAVQEATRRTMLPVVPVAMDKPASDKVVRARLAEARAAARKIHRPVEVDSGGAIRPPSWWSSFAKEVTFFPAGAHDDQVDALSGVMRLVGWDSSVTQWAMGVYACANCHHLFQWAALRPCPKCGTKAPAEYTNPEGSFAPDPSVLEAEAPVEPFAAPPDEEVAPEVVQARREAAARILTWQEREIADKLAAGQLLAFRAPDWPRARDWVANVAGWFLETEQAPQAAIALSEIARLDKELGFSDGLAEYVFPNGNGTH